MAHSDSTTSSNQSGGKFADDSSFYGSVLDQLHAEQKGTIEALTCQVEFYRQREERHKKELDTLRRCLPLGGGKGDDARASVAKLASENRTLGEELDALRGRKNAWQSDRERLERQKRELEKQLKDAKHTLAGFSQAIEQLELKMQRKEAEVQTHCLELEQELRAKMQECERLEQEKDTAEQQLENLQMTSGENQRLRGELQALLHPTEGRHTYESQVSSSCFSSEIKSISDKLNGLEEHKRRQESDIQQLQSKLAASVAEVSASQLEAERKNSAIKEMQLKLDNTSNLLTLREQLLASDGNSRREGEVQRQELLALISTLQREKGELLLEISGLHREQELTKTELQTTKARLSSKDHSVMVSTLRSEVSSLKERLRSEFKHEKDGLRSETQALKQEVSQLRGRIAEKELAARGLEDQILCKDEKKKQADYNARQLREQLSRLQAELEQTRRKYQQLQECRTALAKQLDFGFKELLNDEESAAFAHEEVEKLRHELNCLKKENAVLESERQTATEELELVTRQNRESTARQSEKIDDLYRQLLEKEELIASLKSADRQVALLEQEKGSWEGNVTDIRLRCESRVETEVRKADGLRARIEQLEQDKLSLKQRIEDLEEDSAKQEEKVQASKQALHQKEQEVESLKRDVVHLERQYADASESIKSGRQEKLSVEKKLLKERKTMESEVTQLVRRIESVSKRNLELGDKVIALAKQSKVDQTDLVALSSQVKSYKEQVKDLEGQLGQIHQRSRDSDSVRNLQQKLGDLTCLKESYQVEINKLRQAMDHVRTEVNLTKQQRDEAVKRVRLLVQSREQMKATVEDHTAELIEEIEALQHQLDNERKRCAVLLANEKTLLRDLKERNAAATKLQRTVSVLQQRQQQVHESVSSPTSSSRRRSRGSSSPGTPVNSSNESTVQTTSSLSPQQPEQRSAQQQQESTSVSSSGRRPAMAPAKEMEHLLRNLERISDFSSQAHHLQY
ncbi:hypothetical protein BBJ28_00017627 [Nothophytophthora sp. Chile5]|nr:hypothetical protein BBJ28_00017627 [Nothophytophthora sp. Chile5]